MAGLIARIDDERTPIAEIAGFLDGLATDERWREVARLDRGRQRALYEKAAAAPGIDLAHLVGDAGPLQEVVHDGVNTLPLPAAWQRFQKRFCRPASSDRAAGARLFGYNEGPSRRLVGPGYFVAESTTGRPRWSARGAVVIDYFQVPDGAVAAGWPPIVGNDWRLQRLVYHRTRDFLRRVSRDVAIGAAYRGERPLDHYFVLCRRK